MSGESSVFTTWTGPEVRRGLSVLVAAMPGAATACFKTRHLLLELGDVQAVAFAVAARHSGERAAAIARGPREARRVCSAERIPLDSARSAATAAVLSASS